LSIDEPEESSNAWTLAELEDSADLGSLQAAWTGNDERYA
jgi:hypothetical protein